MTFPFAIRDIKLVPIERPVEANVVHRKIKKKKRKLFEDDPAAVMASMPMCPPQVIRKPAFTFEWDMEIKNVNPEFIDLLWHGGENPCIVRGEN